MFGNFNTKVRNFIISLEAALFSLNFISIKDVLPDQLTKRFEFEQPNRYLELIGLENGSTFINDLGIFTIFLD